MVRGNSMPLGPRGFTLIEMLVTIAVLAVLLAVAVPSFTSQIQSGRAQMAADGLKRAAANARAIASQTGKRTVLSINSNVTDCGTPAAWAITQGTTVLGCLSQADFSKRYESSTIVGNTQTVVFLPTGIATNTSAVSFTLSSGSSSKTVRINAGGSVDVL